jgi:hypothetical protein
MYFVSDIHVTITHDLNLHIKISDSVKVKPQLVLSSSTSDVIRPSAASSPILDEKKPRSAFSTIGAVLSLIVKSFYSSDQAFK